MKHTRFSVAHSVWRKTCCVGVRPHWSNSHWVEKNGITRIRICVIAHLLDVTTTVDLLKLEEMSICLV